MELGALRIKQAQAGEMRVHVRFHEAHQVSVAVPTAHHRTFFLRRDSSRQSFDVAGECVNQETLGEWRFRGDREQRRACESLARSPDSVDPRACEPIYVEPSPSLCAAGEAESAKVTPDDCELVSCPRTGFPVRQRVVRWSRDLQVNSPSFALVQFSLAALRSVEATFLK